jgi:hypothetical protein
VVDSQGGGDQPVANSVPNTQPNPTRKSKSLRGNALSVLTLTACFRPVGRVEHFTLRNHLRNQDVGADKRSSNPRRVFGEQGSAAEPREEVRDGVPQWRRAERYAQTLDGEHDRAANQIRRMRPSARAHVVDHASDNQRVGDQRW